MSNESSQFGGSDLERVLLSLGKELDRPPVPDLARLVSAHLREHPRPTMTFRLLRMRGRFSYPLVAAMVSIVLILAISTDVRTTVASWFHIPGVLIESGVPPPGPLGHNLALGTRTTLSGAQKRVGFPILVPTVRGFKRPDEVYVATPPEADSVSLLYRARRGAPRAAATGAGLLVGESAASMYLAKMVPISAINDRVTVNGAPGFWIGEAHVLYYLDLHHHGRRDTIRLAGNTLVWERPREGRTGVTFRIEGRISERRALQIARSMKVAVPH